MHNLYSLSVCVQKDHFGWLSESAGGNESPAERTGVSMCVHCVHWVMKGRHSSLLSQSSSRDGCRGKCILPGAFNAALLASDILTHTLWHITTQHINTWEHGCHLDMPKHRHTGRPWGRRNTSGRKSKAERHGYIWEVTVWRKCERGWMKYRMKVLD